MKLRSPSRHSRSGASSCSGRPVPGQTSRHQLGTRALRSIAALMLCAAVTGVASGTAAAQSRVTLDKTTTVSSNQLAAAANGYARAATLARAAGAGCSHLAPTALASSVAAIQYFTRWRVTPFGAVTGIWATAVYNFTNWVSGQDYCKTFVQAAQGAEWATYYARVGGAVTRLYVYHEARSFRPDVCHIYEAFGPTANQMVWRVWDLTTSAWGGCPGE
jgi:hypothetical protein